MDDRTNTQNTPQEDEYVLDLRVLLSDMWRGFVKFWWIPVLAALLFGGVQFYRTYIRFVPMYTSSATFTVHTESSLLEDDSGVDSYSFYYNRNTADQLEKVFPYVMRSPLLTDQVCADLGVPAMPATVSASVIPGSNMITLTTRGTDPQMTYDVLLSVVRNYSSVTEYIIGRTKLLTITEPTVPEAPYNALAWHRSVLLGVLLGLFLGFVWIVLYAVLRRTIRTKEDVRTTLRQHCLGVLPQVMFKKYRQEIDTSILLTNPRIGNDFLESLRLLRGAVHNQLGGRHKILTVTSTAPGEGKTVTAVNLAAMCGRSQQKVLLIDGDFRNSGMDRMLDGYTFTPVREKEGVYTIEQNEALSFDRLRFTDSRTRGYRLLRSSALQPLLEELREQYDLILIDTPPCGIISDAIHAAELSDGVLFVIRQDTILCSRIISALQTLQSQDIPLLGCVLTGVSGGLGGYGSHYGYGGYHKYYYGYRHHTYGYGESSRK